MNSMSVETIQHSEIIEGFHRLERQAMERGESYENLTVDVKGLHFVSVRILLLESEKQLVEDYAKRRGITVEDAFLLALFRQIHSEYGELSDEELARLADEILGKKVM